MRLSTPVTRALAVGSFPFFVVAMSPTGSLRAEWFEHQSGGEALVLFPRFDNADPTAFDNISFGTRLHYAFGIAQDWYVVARGTFWLHDGVLKDFERIDPRRGALRGALSFSGEGYRGELGIRRTLLSGFDLTPRLEAFVGYQWTTFRDPDLGNEAGSFGLDMKSFGEGALTLGGGAVVDYRLVNTVLLGLSLTWTRVLSGIYGQDVSAALVASYYWF